MQAYRSWWSAIWGTVTLLGLLLSYLVLSSATVIVVFGFAVAAAVVITVIYDQVKPGWQAPRISRGRTCCIHCGVAGVVALAVTAAGTLSGALLMFALLAASGSSPWALRLLLGKGPSPWATAAPGSAFSVVNVSTDPLSGPLTDLCLVVPPGTSADSALSSSLQTMPDAELCEAWQMSFSALSDTNSAEVQVRIVELRQAYLDEMDRRHPAGLAAWLTSGARPAGSPAAYLASREPSTGELPRPRSDPMDRPDEENHR